MQAAAATFPPDKVDEHDLRLCGRPRHDAPRSADALQGEASAVGDEQGLRHSAPCSALTPANDGALGKGKIELQGQRPSAPERRPRRDDLGRARTREQTLAACRDRAGRSDLHRHAGRRRPVVKGDRFEATSPGCNRCIAIGSRAVAILFPDRLCFGSLVRQRRYPTPHFGPGSASGSIQLMRVRSAMVRPSSSIVTASV